MTPEIMAELATGPTPAYAAEYKRLNQRINDLSVALAEEIQRHGYAARPLAASERTDPETIRGDFPHKTAATRAGIGWIGRHCQLITRPFGGHRLRCHRLPHHQLQPGPEPSRPPLQSGSPLMAEKRSPQPPQRHGDHWHRIPTDCIFSSQIEFIDHFFKIIFR